MNSDVVTSGSNPPTNTFRNPENLLLFSLGNAGLHSIFLLSITCLVEIILEIEDFFDTIIKPKQRDLPVCLSSIILHFSISAKREKYDFTCCDVVVAERPPINNFFLIMYYSNFCCFIFYYEQK